MLHPGFKSVRKSPNPIRTVAWCIAVLLCFCAPLLSSNTPAKPFQKWTREEAISILTRSAWAKQETFTRIVGGIGSGISGQKEIYSTFFVRFLSARPIREAYARLRQIQARYDQLDKDAKRDIDASLAPGLNLDVSRWIVVTLGFRSNDPSVELRIKQFLEVQTTETMKTRAYLSSPRFPQLKLAAYFPPKEEEVGAKFVFPRAFEGAPIVGPEDSLVTFELDVPGFDPDLRVNFPVPELLVKGVPVL